jgi:hypothetical protein
VERKGGYLRSTQLMPYDGGTYLGAVSVDNDNSKALIHERRYLGRSRSYVLILFFERPFLIAPKNGITAKGENCYGSPGRQARFVSSKESTRRWSLLSLTSPLQSKAGYSTIPKLQTKSIPVRQILGALKGELSVASARATTLEFVEPAT